jgi:hypothetical protein
MFKSLGAAEQQAETEAFQCGRCKQVRAPVLYGVVLADTPHRGNAITARRKLVALMSL